MQAKPKIYVTRRLPDEVINWLGDHCEMDMWESEETPVPYEELERQVEEVEGLYCLLTDRIDASLIARAKRLKVISTMAVGYNNIDVEAATSRGVLVANTPGVLTETTADLTFALLMATARRITESSEFLRSGKWKTWSPLLLTGMDVYGATLGIIGMGSIGEAVARRARGFNMNILYHNRSRKPEVERELGAVYADKRTLLRESDFVVLLTPLTPETRHLIGREELRLMKNTAVLINVARGGIVDEAALYEALKNNEIWAAGLDVFEQEPVPLNHPLLTLPNVVTLPHIGSASVKTRMSMAHLAARQLVDALNGKMPAHAVNRAVWQKD